MNYICNPQFLCYSGTWWPVTAATHGVYDKKARQNPLEVSSSTAVNLTANQGTPSTKNGTISFSALPPRTWFLPHHYSSSLPAPSAVFTKRPGKLPPCFSSVCVDITSRLFGCVCRSVMTELNTGIYPEITSVSGQALCRNWVCGTDSACVLRVDSPYL